MLAMERAKFTRDITALQTKCAEAEAKVVELGTNCELLQNATRAADLKVSKLGMELNTKVCRANTLNCTFTFLIMKQVLLVGLKVNVGTG
jgi:hypothetical protein